VFRIVLVGAAADAGDVWSPKERREARIEPIGQEFVLKIPQHQLLLILMSLLQTWWVNNVTLSL